MNRTLRERDPPLRCNRGMQRKTWESRGVEYASELALQNVSDLSEILRWNVDRGIYFYRCTSDLVPWNSQFELTELPDYEEIARIAADCGRFILENEMRFTFHPSHWCKLASESTDTVENSIRDLEIHGSWLDLFGLPRTPYYGINVHIGAHYDDKAATAERFRDAVNRLSPAARERLTVENDDKEGLWSVPELVDAVAEPLGVPVVFDYHHHQFASRGLTYREAFETAARTWGDVRPVAHYSEPARLYGGDARPQAHADYVASVPDWLLDGADVMLEAKEKERALLRYRDETASIAES
ncbi:UV DNA damage repair endonuclease UvsE [Halogeometricum sp. S1BR25-6]|uniref:UV DNA damage repair endonuclease UvsE n=2 Tax=Halogeometricum salsisoli TaxID=2950536 RepID=A0ABU2GGW3_9EURY|nr:UV DNA damage repair endonuclease UvsE [Halogeometricum sp. S1BR25-6]